MDPLSALGVASNIVQLVAFSHELLSSAREISSSVGGTSKEVNQLRLLAENIRQSRREFSKVVSSDDDKNSLRLYDIGKECDDVAEALIKKLARLQTKRKGFARKIEAFAVAGRHWWTKDEINSLKARLFELEARLSRWWQIETQEENYSSLAGKIDDLRRLMERLEAPFPEEQLEKLKGDLNHDVEDMGRLARSMKSETLGGTGTEKSKQQMEMMEAHMAALRDTTAALRKMHGGIQMIERQEAVLRSLSFSAIHRRHDDISKAHRETLQWVFDNEETKFKKWLQEGQGVFWISGLAGSGKSTLMKYVSDDQKTSVELETWAPPPLRLCIAAHFFWSSGSEMQKSQQGLLQSLLFQVLAASPSLADMLCPGYSATTPWDMDGLRAAFKRLSEETDLGTKFCFFIDGLDEYKGNVEDIVQLVKELATSKHVKICVSSRPWPGFSAAWGQSNQNLKVQDLTKDDMDKYIREMLEENQHFQEAARIDSRYTDLAPEISKRAEGVWLWVSLVTRDLIRDMRDGETYEQLLVRLDSYPQELEDYFRSMLNRIDKVHQKESAQILLCALEAVAPMSLLILPHFSDWRRLIKSPTPPMTRGSSPATVEEMEALHGLWQPRLQNRCGDLLKISRSESSTAVRRYEVDFLHKTVRDFLIDEYLHNLRQRAPQDFDELLFLGKATLRLIGCFGPSKSERNYPSVLECPPQAVIYAQAIQRRNTPQDDSVAQLSLMDGFERACEAAFLLVASHLTLNRQDCEEDSDDMLEAAAKLNLYYYVKSKLEKDPARVKGSTYGLLHQVLQAQYMKRFFPPKFKLLFYSGFADEMASEPDERIVGLLLDYKADPNQRLEIIWERTPFTAFVDRLEENWRDCPACKQQQLFRVLKLLLQRGADPMLKKSRMRQYEKVAAHDVGHDDMGEISVVEYLSYTFDRSRTAELGGLVDSILKKRRTESAGMVSKMLQWAFRF